MTGLEMALQVVVLCLMVGYLFVPVWARVLLVLLVISIWVAFFAYCEIAFQANIEHSTSNIQR